MDLGTRLLIAATALLLTAAQLTERSVVWAGSYSNIVECEESGEDAGCRLGRPQVDHHQCLTCDTNLDQPCCFVPAFGIVHPLGYVGLEQDHQLSIRVCVKADSMQLAPAVQRSIATWEALAPTTGNCNGCGTTGDPIGALAEEFNPTTGLYFADTTILHEIGHCAMGLDHINRLWDDNDDGIFSLTSFTRSGPAVLPDGLDEGPDGIRGSEDDVYIRQGGLDAISVSWFRIADNDPFIVDGATIDSTTYSRSLNNLPVDKRGASGNRRVGDDPLSGLGYPSTQAVMYGGTVRGQYYSGLSADDVNMIRMGMTGRNRMLGGEDDYTIDLTYVGECETNSHDIKVYEGNPGNIFMGGGVGVCTLDEINWSYQQPLIQAHHMSIVKALPATPLEVILNPAIPWDYDDPRTPIFTDGFESGDATSWSSVVP